MDGKNFRVKGLVFTVMWLSLGFVNIQTLSQRIPFDDVTPPMTTATPDPMSPNSNGWYRVTVLVTLNATDNESGVNATYYQINQEEWIAYTGTFEIQRCGIIIVQFYLGR